MRGVSYQLGGDSPTAGFDCSGLVQYVFAQEAIDLPRTVAQQFRAGKQVSEDHVAPGDLVFFSTTASGATHVGIVIDKGRFIHAPGAGSVVRVEQLETPYWSKRLVEARRVADLN
jgi:cell wall-associated NlpC family hydrolase